MSGTDSNAEKAGFVPTQWSLVLAAGRRSTPEAKEALGTPALAYWYPLYAYVRRRGYAVADAQDLTQEFFTQLIEKNHLKDADRERGRFRSFPLDSMKHFPANESIESPYQPVGRRIERTPFSAGGNSNGRRKPRWGCVEIDQFCGCNYVKIAYNGHTSSIPPGWFGRQKLLDCCTN